MPVEFSHFWNGVKTYTRLLLSSRPPPRTIQNAFSIRQAVYYDYNISVLIPPSTYSPMVASQFFRRHIASSHMLAKGGCHTVVNSCSALACHDCQLKQWNLLYFYQKTNKRNLYYQYFFIHCIFNVFTHQAVFIAHIKRAVTQFLSLFLIKFTLNM